MQEWLYGEDGYYGKYKEIGKQGDFYTAVSSSMFFGGSIAKRLISLVEEGFLPKDTTILEIGAHKGYLLADIVQFIFTLKPSLLDTLRFATLEKQEGVAKMQKEYFKNSFGDKIELKVFRDFSEISLSSSFVVANEIFDAFACEAVKEGKMLYMDGFEPYFDEQDSSVKEMCERYSIQKGEVALGYEAFAKDLSKSIDRFEFVTFDYGDKDARSDFSLRIYDKHRVYPFFSLTKFAKDETLEKEGKSLETLYKKSDITYDVNFTHLIEAFKQNGVHTHSYQTQLKALVEFGIIELLEMLRKNSDEKTYLNELNKVKQLIDPSFMGERFKCVVFRKV